ncbi:hypothetical protein FACS1894190_17320 [Spirochaetia bacterium]|nr:hypothetical protein FACS1894190_17320 [Spirochaetia bacterium]
MANKPTSKVKKVATEQKRTTAQVFDLLFKQLLHLSNKAVISLICPAYDELAVIGDSV